MNGKSAFAILVGVTLAIGASACGSENCDRLDQICAQCTDPNPKVVCDTVVVDGDEDTCASYADLFEQNGC